MPWNPDIYNKFKDQRYEPFYDLLSLIKPKQKLKAIDLGCGTGELTKKLADHLKDADITGIDSSREMLHAAKAFAGERVQFKQQLIEDALKAGDKYDLVFSNAAIQWIDGHKKLLPNIVALLNAGGQIAIQVPSNDDHFTHTSLRKIASGEPYRSVLKEWARTSPVLTIEEYSRILFENGCKEMNVYEKVYAHVLDDSSAVFDWTAGTALIRYLDKLPETFRAGFTNAYKAVLDAEYGTGKTVFYPFKRTLIHGLF